MMVDHTNLQGGIDAIDTNGNGELYWEEGNIDTDPFFTDPGNNDFSLEPNSPCINAGTAFLFWAGNIIVDFSENEYSGITPDMGAFEYEGTNSVEPVDPIPSDFVLKPAYPNPFNPITTIVYDVPYETQVTLTVYDLRGRIVIDLVNDNTQAGTHRIVWNGTNNDGQPMPSGMYFCQLKSEGFVETRKLILLK